MPKSKKAPTTRTKVKNLPAAPTKLTAKQAKNVKGGIGSAGGGVWKTRNGGVN